MEKMNNNWTNAATKVVEESPCSHESEMIVVFVLRLRTLGSRND